MVISRRTKLSLRTVALLLLLLLLLLPQPAMNAPATIAAVMMRNLTAETSSSGDPTFS